MSNIYTLALRKAAERASAENHTQDEWFHYLRCSTPETVLALLDELEAVQKTSAARLGAIDTTHKMFQRERDRAEKAEKRIAELQIARDKCFLSGLKTGWEYGIADETEGYNREIADAQAVVDRAAAAGKGE